MRLTDYNIKDFEVIETGFNSCGGCYFQSTSETRCWHNEHKNFVNAVFNQHPGVNNGNCTRLVAKLKDAS